MCPETLVNFAVQFGKQPNHSDRNGIKLQVQAVNFWYGDKQALSDVSLDIYEREVTAFVGPSGCGKTTLLKCMNRINDIVADARMQGRILLDGKDIHASSIDPPLLRRRFGWVAQKPNPFPWSIYHNVAYAPKIHGLVQTRGETDALVQDCLERTGLWEEVKDRLREPGTDLSGGQQQRLCVARAISCRPEVILMDEPASALDPPGTAKLEDLIDSLRESFTIVIVTHNMQQAARVAQRVAFFHLGSLIEYGDTEQMFLRPQQRLAQDYITGRIG